MNECNCSLTDKSLGDGCRVCNPQEMIDLLLEHITELEQCIVELKVAKSCEGCKYNRFGCDSLGYATDCTIQFKICSRACDDYYEPKEQK